MQYILYAAVFTVIVGAMSEIGNYQYNPMLRNS